MTPWDYGVVVFYLIFIMTIGFIFQRFNNNISDYFKGGGSIQWWMLGSSIFMAQFSAWTFTGAAGKAYSTGIFIFALFVGNAIGFLVNFLGMGQRLCQLRVITSLDAVKERFNRFTEQSYFLVGLITDSIVPAFWLFALSIFVSSVFGLNLRLVIIVTGVVVVFMSMSGGSWAVIASDFIQSMVLMFIAITTTVLILLDPRIGGLTGFVEQVPDELFIISEMGNSVIIWCFIGVLLVKQVVATNNLSTAYRYVSARDSVHAKWAGFLAMVLVVIGPFFWFLPPMAARILVPDIGSLFPLLNNPEEAAFIAAAQQVFPIGMMGILVSGIFAATMSTMDTGLNVKSAQVVKNFYLPNLRPGASQKELVLVGRLVTCFFGIVIIMVTIMMESIRGWTLFDLYMLVTGIASLPMIVPQFLGILLRKAPRWAGWATTLFGFSSALAIHFTVNGQEQFWADRLGLGLLSFSDTKDFYFIAMNAGIMVFCSLFFVGTTFFYERTTTEMDREELDAFFKKMRKPVVYEEEAGAVSKNDAMQFKVLGILSAVFGGFLVLLMLIPNDWQGRLAFLGCGGAMLVVAAFLYFGYRRTVAREALK